MNERVIILITGIIAVAFAYFNMYLHDALWRASHSAVLFATVTLLYVYGPMLTTRLNWQRRAR